VTTFKRCKRNNQIERGKLTKMFHNHENHVSLVPIMIVTVLVEHRVVRTVIRGHHINGGLICGHHNSRIGYLPDQLCGQTAVQSPGTFFAVNGKQRLEKAPVLGTFFAEPGSGDFCKHELRINKICFIQKKTKV